MYLQDPLIAQVEAELEVFKALKRQELEQLFELAGDAVVGFGECGCSKESEESSCQCMKGKSKYLQGAAKRVDLDGHPVESDDSGDRDNSEQSSSESNEDISSWQEIEDILNMDAIYHGNKYDACTRFEPPDRPCQNPITDNIVSDVVNQMRPPSIRASKLQSMDNSGIRTVYTDTIDAIWEQRNQGVDVGTMLTSDVMCGAVDTDVNGNVTQCFTGVPSSCMPPCLKQQTMSDFFALDLTSAKDYVKFSWTLDAAFLAGVGWVDKWGGESTADEFFVAAVSLLAANVDIIRWIVCRISTSDFSGNAKTPDNWDDCLIEFITGAETKFKTVRGIKFRMTTHNTSNTCEVSDFWSSKSIVGPAVVHVCVESSQWGIYWNSFDSARAGSSHSPEIDRAAILIDFAATILHELTHACGRAFGKKHGDSSGGHGACAESYRTENMFRWAMYNRYPDAATSGCRSITNVSDMWGSNTSIYSTNGCQNGH